MLCTSLFVCVHAALVAVCAFADRAQSNYEDMTLSTETATEEWKWCNVFSSVSDKTYYFEFTEAGTNVAVRLKRTKTDPSLELFRNHSWDIRYQKGILSFKEGIKSRHFEWNLEPDDMADPTLTISFLQTQSLTFIENGGILEIQQMAAQEPLKLAGGIFYREDVMLQHGAKGQMSDEAHVSAGDVKETAKSAKNLLFKRMAEGSFWGMPAGFYPAMVAGLAFGGPLGSVAFAAASTATGIAAGGLAGIQQHYKWQREMGLSMTEKIFEKLRCLKVFYDCGKYSDGRYVLVRRGSKCPPKAKS